MSMKLTRNICNLFASSYRMQRIVSPLVCICQAATVNRCFSQSIVEKEKLAVDVKLKIPRTGRRKRLFLEDEQPSTTTSYSVVALSTAEEYNLRKMYLELKNDDEYAVSDAESVKSGGTADFIHLTGKCKVEKESQDIYVFREGSIVAWNAGETELQKIVRLLQKYEIKSYSWDIVHDEKEVMPYTYISNNCKKSSLRKGNIRLACKSSSHNQTLDKYTFSNVMALSVKLGIWEVLLDKYIESVSHVTEDLKYGREIRISKKEVLMKMGELFALRHSINLTSGLLDVPDFYWEREELESLYLQTSSYFSISKRTRVMNEKMNHCMELVDLLASVLSDRHHIRLEWMIIALITVEVLCEIIHYGSSFVG